MLLSPIRSVRDLPGAAAPNRMVVYAKRPFGGPQAVLAYLSRYTHRVAIANSRLVACDRSGVTFRWKIIVPRAATARRS